MKGQPMKFQKYNKGKEKQAGGTAAYFAKPTQLEYFVNYRGQYEKASNSSNKEQACS